jgi:uncharacterized protein YbjT (DUF2867 family)
VGWTSLPATSVVAHARRRRGGQGLFGDIDTLGAAFAGADRAFLFPFEGEVEGVMDIMRDAAIRRVVVLSSMEVDDVAEDDGSDFQQTVERAVEQSGFDRTHVRARGFATPGSTCGCRTG